MECAALGSNLEIDVDIHLGIQLNGRLHGSVNDGGVERLSVRMRLTAPAPSSLVIWLTGSMW